MTKQPDYSSVAFRKFLQALSQQFPSSASAATEIIRLKALLSLPKGTEHFLSDVHGEYESFNHVIRNSSGSIKKRIQQLFAHELTKVGQKTLATLIYYPEEKLDVEMKKHKGSNYHDWLQVQLYRLIKIARSFAAQYTRRYLHNALPTKYGSLIDELLHVNEQLREKHHYFHEMIATVLNTHQAKGVIAGLAYLIQRLAISRLHIIGDVYDRGPAAEKIMDILMEHPSVDFQWGNHDIVWMGAAAGSWACMTNVLRVSLRYNNTDTLEDGYGISLLPLATFALEYYKNDDNQRFLPKLSPETHLNEKDVHLRQIMQKAIAIIQLKLEGQLIARNPHFKMEHRSFLETIDIKNKTVRIEGKEYTLTDTNFPTIQTETPYELTAEESEVVERLATSFTYSERLQRHTRFLYEKGGMYLNYNGNLLLHGCVPMTEEGNFASFDDRGTAYSSKALLERFEVLARQAYFGDQEFAQSYPQDIMWYLWCGSHSPLFGKSKMATFESYFVADKAILKEPKNAYYSLRNTEQTCNKILEAFGLPPATSHILNGHVPVVVKKGESPIKANGKLLVIDGGFAKAYQAKTGIAGYTLISDAQGLHLVAHEPFDSTSNAILAEKDILSSETILEQRGKVICIKDTDKGKAIREKIADLKILLQAYREGSIKEKQLF